MKTRRIVSLICAFSLMVTSLSAVVFAKDRQDEITQNGIIDAHYAAIMASLFVRASLEDSLWSDSIAIEEVIPLYDKYENTSFYYVGIVEDEKPSGYVIVSVDTAFPLIVEYSDHDELAVHIDADDTLLTESIKRVKESKIYYSPLYCATFPIDLENGYGIDLSDEDKDKNQLLALSMIELINSSGIMSISYGDYYSDPLDWLEVIEPGNSFFLTGSNSISSSLIQGYIIDCYNGCVVFSAACILYRYLKNTTSYSFSDISSICKQIATSNGYSNSSTNYYISLSNTIPFIQSCVNYFSLNKTVSWSFMTINNIKSEVSNGYPFALNIAASPQYSDHTVTGFGWATYACLDNENLYTFIKLKDGYSTQTRYVCSSYLTLPYINTVH